MSTIVREINSFLKIMQLIDPQTTSEKMESNRHPSSSVKIRQKLFLFGFLLTFVIYLRDFIYF